LHGAQPPISIVNLDPANDNIPYPCAIDIASLITLQDVMSEHGLGPNGGMLYCMEYLEANYDWLEDRLRELGKDAYVLFDLPGQVELSTNHNSLKRIIEKLGKSGFRVSDTPLLAAHALINCGIEVRLGVALVAEGDVASRIAAHQRLSKIDLLTQYGDLDFNLEFYTEVQDLSYLENALSSASPRYSALNMAICGLIEDFGLVGFETLAVEVRGARPGEQTAIKKIVLTRSARILLPPGQALDAEPHARHRPRDGLRLRSPRAGRRRRGAGPPGALPEPSSAAPSAQPNAYALLSSAMGARVGLQSDVRDVQERWVDAREEWDAHERTQWRREGDALRQAASEVEKQRKLNVRERK
ncbi:hypothetical protein BC826DRAFT_1001519, partial [Russula brevipes]